MERQRLGLLPLQNASSTLPCSGTVRIMSAVSLLTQLRAAGASITCDRGRLIIEAPAGLMTPELRTELVKYKAELIAMVKATSGNIGTDAETIEARNRIAGLLAMAHRRIVAMKCAGERQATPGNHELAKLPRSSVHGVVP